MIVDVGATETLAVFPATGVINEVGLHRYVPPAGKPVAVNVVDCPAQRFVSGETMVTVACELITRRIESTAVHPDLVSVTVTT